MAVRYHRMFFVWKFAAVGLVCARFVIITACAIGRPILYYGHMNPRFNHITPTPAVSRKISRDIIFLERIRIFICEFVQLEFCKAVCSLLKHESFDKIASEQIVQFYHSCDKICKSTTTKVKFRKFLAIFYTKLSRMLRKLQRLLTLHTFKEIPLVTSTLTEKLSASYYFENNIEQVAYLEISGL